MRSWLTLIKSVLNSIPIYVHSVRIFPIRVQKTLHNLMSKFLWGGSENSRKLHLMDCDTVTSPMNKRGVRMAKLNDLNTALVVKWIYIFANERDNLWRRVVCARSGVDPCKILPIVTSSSRKSSLFNIIGLLLDRNDRAFESSSRGLDLL